MRKIKLFLASSAELKAERESFEREIYRKCKTWFGQDIFLHLDIWEDISAKVAETRLQDEYNKFIKEADVFVLLAFTKVGMYTAEEFENAFGQFKTSKKPFIFTYFKEANINIAEVNQNDLLSLLNFKKKLSDLGHFYAPYKDFNDLWNQFNKELDRMAHENFQQMSANKPTTGTAVDNSVTENNQTTITGNDNIAATGVKNSNITINKN